MACTVRHSVASQMEVDLEVVDLVEVDLVEVDMMAAVVGAKVAVVVMTEGGADHVTEIVGVAWWSWTTGLQG
jgi:hypothetical protein